MSDKHGKPNLVAAPVKAATPGYEARILRLVRGAQERRALELGEVDAVIEPLTGQPILLPDAQTALLAQQRHFRSLVNLAADGYWEQDENYRFTSTTGITPGTERGADIIGRTLWELSFENRTANDWLSHRAQLDRHAVFRDLELRQTSDQRHVSLSGEPMFDAAGSFRGYRGITRDISPLRAVIAQPTLNTQLERAALNAWAAPLCLLDAQGVIVMTNSAWRSWAEMFACPLVEGGHYISACEEQVGLLAFDSEAIAAGVSQVMRGERPMFRFEHGFATARGPRWFMVSISALRQGGALQVMLTHEDISEQKRGAQWLALESAVATGLARAADADAALCAVLRAVCAVQQWDCGQYFAYDAATATLRHTAQGMGDNAPEVERFLARSPSGSFRADAGLVGRVCRANQPLWIIDAERDPRSATALPHETGLRGIFMFPVSIDDALLGVLVFGSRVALCEPDSYCLRSILNVGNLLGLFLRREAEQQRIRLSEQRFRRYAALGCDWHWEINAELRFVSTTAAGIGGVSDILGKRLWELPHLRVAEGEWTRLEAELDAQWSFCDFPCTAVLADGREAKYYLSGEPIFDDADVLTGFLGIGLDVTLRAT